MDAAREHLREKRAALVQEVRLVARMIEYIDRLPADTAGMKQQIQALAEEAVSALADSAASLRQCARGTR